MRMTTCNGWRLGWALTLLSAAAACDGVDAPFTVGGFHYPATGLTQWALPEDLQEVSGLALDSQGRLFAHADEAAVVFELDIREGRALRRFTLGDPPQPGDFEGMAWVENRLYMVTSDGDLISAEVAEDGAHTDYQLQRTGLGRRCEIEGLDYDPPRRLLLMPCKTAREKPLKRHVAVLAWSLDQLAPAPEHDLLVPWAKAKGLAPPLNPSGLTRSPRNGNLILTAARQQALIELTPEGALLQALVIPRADEHPQMEGIVMTAYGDLVIADEGQNGRGRLSVYRAKP